MMSRRIRILYTISNFNTAGSGKVLYDLAKNLDSSKFDIEIACGDNKGEFFRMVEALGYPIHIFETKTPYRPYLSLPMRILKIRSFYKKNKYDLIHSWQWSSDWTEALAAKLAGVKWIYTKKAMGFNSRHWKYKSYLADFIITINDEMRAYFPNKDNQKLIPLGLDTNYYNPSNFEFNDTKDLSKFRIITVANLVPVKGIEVLLKALSLLKDTPIELTVLGDNTNSYGKSVMAFSEELGLDKQVVFIGKQLDVRPYLVKSDLYVIPTLDQGRKEGMPMALVEAMAMGVPVVGSNITGINYVLKDFKHLLFEAGNPESLSTKISYLMHLDAASRRCLGDDLRKYCVTNFSLEAFTVAHETLYSELVYE